MSKQQIDAQSGYSGCGVYNSVCLGRRKMLLLLTVLLLGISAPVNFGGVTFGKVSLTSQIIWDAQNLWQSKTAYAAPQLDATFFLSDITAVSAGGSHTCALTKSGGVKCWGYNQFGQLGDGSKTNRIIPVDVRGLSSGVSAISAGLDHTCALTTSGGVKCWGADYTSQPGDISKLIPMDISGLSSGVSAISAGGYHDCALLNNGGVKCWGMGDQGQLGDGGMVNQALPVDVSGLSSGVSAISAGHTHTCALMNGGGVKCWGRNVEGQVGDGSGLDWLVTPVDVNELSSGIRAIAASGSHTCALTTGGGVKCWGQNIESELGDGSQIDRRTPVDVSGLSSGITAISSRLEHTCALTESGGVKCWGPNNSGQLGDGSQIDRRTPVDVRELDAGVISVSAGGFHTCAFINDGSVKCWGTNNEGQLGSGQFKEIVPFAVQPVSVIVLQANDDRFATNTITPVTIDVLANDVGNLDPARVTIVNQSTHGLTSVNSTTGEITYTPQSAVTSVDRFVYQVCTTDGLCTTATVTISIYSSIPQQLRICVADGDFTTVKVGLNVVPAGGTLDICAGTYLDNLTIDKDVTLQGVDKATTIINGQSNATVITINNAKVAITNLTIMNGSASANANPGRGGGGIWNSGILLLTNSAIRGNDAYFNAALSQGGGIWNKGTVTLVNSTVNDNKSDDGGGIFNDSTGSVSMRNSVLEHNGGPGRGGALYNRGVLAATGCFITNNSSASAGGGIFNEAGVVTLLDCTVSGNGTREGGGIYNQAGGNVKLTRSTINGNLRGGAIFNAGVFEITNSTISKNEGGTAGGITTNGGALSLTNSTVSFNGGVGITSYSTAKLANSIVTHDSTGSRDCVGAITSLGHNLDSDGSCSLTATSDKPNIDPKLGALADNGGPTLTQALLPGSPALDAGDNGNCPATDQRGISRPQGIACDSGAFELEQSSPGVLIGKCASYAVYQSNGIYRAAGWNGAIQVGDNRNNTLTGTSGPDLLLGLGGNDLLKGQGGDDVLCGGDGVDFLQGTDGNDFLDGGAGNDVLNGGSGDYDQLVGGEGNDVLLDGDGVSNAAGGAGNDVLTLALHKGWRNANGQTQFSGLTAGYGNDAVGLAILDRGLFLLDISGDERDNPPSPLEGNNDALALAGVIDPTSSILKFEKRLILSAEAEQAIPDAAAGAQFLTEPVGEDAIPEQTNQLFLPLVVR